MKNKRRKILGKRQNCKKSFVIVFATHTHSGRKRRGKPVPCVRVKMNLTEKPNAALHLNQVSAYMCKAHVQPDMHVCL